MNQQPQAKKIVTTPKITTFAEARDQQLQEDAIRFEISTSKGDAYANCNLCSWSEHLSRKHFPLLDAATRAIARDHYQTVHSSPLDESPSEKPVTYSDPIL